MVRLQLAQAGCQSGDLQAITIEIVETFLKCPTHATWVRAKNDLYRIEGIKRLVAGVAPDKCVTGTQAISEPAVVDKPQSTRIEEPTLLCNQFSGEFDTVASCR
jgi:hypothetical protein